MSGKLQVFKMGGSWIWQCRHSEDRVFSGDFPVAAWNSAWDACLSGATHHAVECHVEPVEVIEG